MSFVACLFFCSVFVFETTILQATNSIYKTANSSKYFTRVHLEASDNSLHLQTPNPPHSFP